MLNKALDYLSFTHYFMRSEKKEIERLFTRVFSSEDGKTVLAYLQYCLTAQCHQRRPTLCRRATRPHQHHIPFK